MTFPSRDRNSDKYPDRIFYQGRWRTPAQVETRRAISRRTDLRRGPARDSLRIRVFGDRYRLPNRSWGAGMLNSPLEEVEFAVIGIDIERAPLVVKTWGLFDQNIGIRQIVEDSRMVSFAAITEGQRSEPLFRSEFHHGRTKMLNDLWDVLDKANTIITYNGKAFDLKHINTELVKAGLSEPSDFRHMDLLPFVRRKFKFDSNKLDYVSQRMRVGKKLDHGVSYFELLDGCEAGDKKSMSLFKKYNIQDTLLNLELHEEFKELGWL
jgi:DNA polymerase elongation subunit (family B)